MEDVGADMDYNLVPSSYENSIDLAVLTKYLWFEVYKKIVDPEFLKQYGPRIIHLIGSPAYNPANGTMILGLAEGGLKVTLFRVNAIDVNDFDQLNEFYFKTMHHEFAHIMHQTKTYPKEFNLLSSAHYDPFGWQDRDHRIVASLGCVTPYGSSQAREDFAEVIANYITKTEADWNQILRNAELNWETDESGAVTGYNDDGLGGLADGVAGREVILQKVAIARNWFRDAWDIDLDALRAEVQLRQSSFDINELRKEVEEMQ